MSNALNCLQNSVCAQKGQAKNTKSPEQLSEAANPPFQPHKLHHRAAGNAEPPTKLDAHHQAIPQRHAASGDMAHGSREGQNAESGDLMDQATALEEAAALRDSAQDPEWLAIAQKVPDGKHMQARADEEVRQALAVPPCMLDHCTTIALVYLRVAVLTSS